MATKALVKPALLAWARESAHIPVEIAAQKAKISLEALIAWESGEGSPSIPQLRNLGQIYKRPIAVFFLSEPPITFDAQREFRKLKGIKSGKESTELLLALRQTTYQREVARELSGVLGESVQISALPEIHASQNAETAGEVIRKTLGISWETQISWGDSYKALKAWKTAIESLDVLTFQTGAVPLDEMRGVCIPDRPFPVILLNSKDAPHGRIFSLMHEFVHILLHASGHQTSRMEGMKSPEEQTLEVAANRIAAAALLPEKPFLAIVKKYPGALQGDNDQLRLLSQKVKTSPETVLRRLVTLGQVRKVVYTSKRREWSEEYGSKPWYVKQGGGGPVPQKIQILSRDGQSFTRMVLEAYDRRLISSSSASDYLNAKPKHFPDLRQELAASPLNRA